MTREELQMEIGKHVLDSFDWWIKKGAGKKVVIPVRIQRKITKKEIEFVFPRFGSWIMSVECEAPRLFVHKGVGDYETLSVSEYFKTIKKLGW